MKQLLFSLLFVSIFSFSFVYAVETTEQQTNNILNYINSTSTKRAITRSDIQDFYNNVQKQTNSQYLSEEDKAFLTLKKDQSVDNYLKAIQVENARRLVTGQSLLPDPTTSTTQIPPNNGTTGTPLEGQAPRINGTVLPITPGNSTSITTPTSVSFLDKIIPLESFKNLGDDPLNKIFNQLFYLGLIIAVVLAVVMIIRGGIEYMTIDAIASKESGKKRVQAALGGLLLAFSAVLILNTINPNITSLKIVFEQLKKIEAINIGGVLVSGVRNQDGTVTTPSGQTVQETANGIIVVNPDGTTFKPEAIDSITGNFVTGKATNFGYQDNMDNGQGSPHLDPNNKGGVVTNRNDIYGVALPQEVLMKELGLPAITNNNWDEWAPARNAGVLVKNGTKSYIVPLVDIGPGEGPLSKGVVIDETKALNQALGGDGNRSYKIIPNYYSR